MKNFPKPLDRPKTEERREEYATSLYHGAIPLWPFPGHSFPDIQALVLKEFSASLGPLVTQELRCRHCQCAEHDGIPQGFYKPGFLFHRLSQGLGMFFAGVVH
jgi:hypothetical protein